MRSCFLLPPLLVALGTVTQAADKALDVVRISSAKSGLLLVVGSEVRENDQLSADRLLMVNVDGVMKKYRRWKKGDRVEVGQLLARLDDRLPRVNLEIAETKVSGCEEDLQFALKTLAEANARYQTCVNLLRSRVVERKDVDWANHSWNKTEEEASSKKLALKLGKLNLKKAQIDLDRHQIRSRYRGIIQAIYKHSGEGVKALEPVFLIQIAND